MRVGGTDEGGRKAAEGDSICWKAEWLPLARRFADRVAITDAGGPVTYEQLYAAAAGVARALMEAGAGPGDVVASTVPNSRHAVAASLGIALSGAAEAPINPALAGEEVAHCLRVCGARVAVTVGTRGGALAGILPLVLAADEVAAADFAALPGVPVDPGAWGRIMFTSGTTGKPKGIVHAQAGRWTANLLLRATLPIAATPGREVLLMTPYSHGASLMTQAFLDGGASVRLLDGVDMAVVADLLDRRAVDQMFAPPTVLAKIVTELEGRRIAGIEAIFCGTAPLPPDLYRKARDIFGPVVRITYGKTEVFNPITVLTPEETDRWYADDRAGDSVCVGWPASGVEVAVGAEKGDEAEAGRVGPVLIRARHMLAATLDEAGMTPHEPGAFHRTGDLGFIDEIGRLHLVGREADVIKTGGYRVTPEEIEGRLRPALGGGELVVFGLPSSYWGEIITVAAAGAPADWRTRLEPAVAELTGYKRPRLFADIAEVSRNAMGKVVRARAREAVLSNYELADGRYPSLESR